MWSPQTWGLDLDLDPDPADLLQTLQFTDLEEDLVLLWSGLVLWFWSELYRDIVPWALLTLAAANSFLAPFPSTQWLKLRVKGSEQQLETSGATNTETGEEEQIQTRLPAPAPPWLRCPPRLQTPCFKSMKTTKHRESPRQLPLPGCGCFPSDSDATGSGGNCTEWTATDQRR